MKKALIVGISGQDGSYLAELLLEKGYEVHGTIRRSSVHNTANLDHILDDIQLHFADLADGQSLLNAVELSDPDEVYNLAAQSQVRISFDVPEYTCDVNALGTLRLLTACRDRELRYYQASTSEMFGSALPPQNEQTGFCPRSPYGISKLFGYWMTKNFREEHEMHASNGILFNHECVTAETPVIIKRNGIMDILPIEEIVPHRTDPRSGLKYTTEPSNIEVWDKDNWVRVTCMTATWNSGEKPVTRIAARGAVFSATNDHIAFTQNEQGEPVETSVGDIRKDDNLALGNYARIIPSTELTDSEAWLLGVLAGDGYVNEDGDARITCNDTIILTEGERTWRSVTGGGSHRWEGKSGFCENKVLATNLTGGNSYGRWIRSQLYTERGDKKVPARILNSCVKNQLAFLRGYNAADGLRAGRIKYEFRSFKTASYCLAAGLWWLIHNALKQRAIICLEDRDDKTYFAINLSVPDNERSGNKGAHLRRPLEEVVKIDNTPYTGWLFDFATESGTFHAGVGNGWIHNSPRRGENFLTQKVVKGAVAIHLGFAESLKLGNLESQRDWGFAPEYVQAMHLMLQQPEPNDYVIATGETHTVREFCHEAFDYLGMDYRDYVVVDEDLYRPTEVDVLLGDYSKAKRVLGWTPKVKFKELVGIMVEAELGE